MKKYSILLLAACAALFTGCSDEEEYTPALPVPENCQQVYFVTDENESAVEVAPEEAPTRTFTMTLAREKTTEAASVPIVAWASEEGVFEVPATAEFAAGAARTTLVVKMLKGEKDDVYTLRLSVDGEEYADPYTQLGGMTVQELKTTIVKWNLLGTGTFVFRFWWEGTQSGLKLYQKDGANEYKIAGWSPIEFDFFFTCDEKGNITVPDQYVGEDHPSYGPVYFTTTNAGAKSVYDSARKIYFFNLRYFCSAGTFTNNSGEGFILD